MNTEENAKTLIDEQLRELGWNLTNFDEITKEYSLPNAQRADYVILYNKKPIAVIEAKKKGVDLRNALLQAKNYAKILNDNGANVILIFASDGEKIYRQNLKANTRPEEILRFMTYSEIKEFIHPETDLLLANLRDYQKIAVSQVISAFQLGKEKTYLEMATGTGKTITAAGIIAKMYKVGLAKRVLFLVDRDSLADQTVRAFTKVLGDVFKINRLIGIKEDKYNDISVSTIQFLYANKKYLIYPNNLFDMVILDECHRSYFGDWYDVVEHFRNGGAKILGLTATPSDKETQNTDDYFGEPVFRYTYNQGVIDGILAETEWYKFLTNIDLTGIHDMGFDFEPEELGRRVDVPRRNEIISEKYFEVINYGKTRIIPKTLIFAASIKHANHLRNTFIDKYNELNNLPRNDASAEEFIVTIHNQIKNAKQLIKEFQQIDSKIRIAISVDMLSTGIDAPDIEVLVMARPTKSKILYVQMKGRATRRCTIEHHGKEKNKFKLIDFVDLTGIEEIITNEKIKEDDLILDENENNGNEETINDVKIKSIKEVKEPEKIEMVIADVPVWLVKSEIITPELFSEIRKQIEPQLKVIKEQTALKARFIQAILSWEALNPKIPVNEKYLEAFGFDINTLREIFGEVDATYQDFIDVALGKKKFKSVEEKNRDAVKHWLEEIKKFNNEQIEFLMMYYDFKKRNPKLTYSQFANSQILQHKGGIDKIKLIFGSLDEFTKVYETMKKINYINVDEFKEE
uniref:Type I restriction modification system, restriction subunit R n=1 Tax=Marinitoga okinawensis TaxID=389480 RepID=A0A9C7GWD4_9BACT|nr:DEAD/DEAH box helicase family protein [Marinitoga okinawensis]CAI4093956.1 Type I restriction modification system, restriction subunit R [Marinitoga okinawensis]